MTTADRGCWPGRVVGRSLGYGAGCGALFGILTLAVIVSVLGLASRQAGFLAAIFFFSPWAAFIGSVIGTACGILACIPLLLAGDTDRRNPSRSRRFRRKRASLAGGGGAALLPAVLAIWAAARGDQASAGLLLCVTAMAAAGGMTLGPRVLYGRRVRARSARNDGDSNGDGPAGQAAAG